MSDSATPWTVAHQAPLSTGFSRQKYWSGLPFPSPGDLPNPEIEPSSPALQAGTLTSKSPGKPQRRHTWLINTWKDAQHHWLLEKCKSRPQWAITSHLSKWLSSKRPQITNAGEDVEKSEPLYTVGGNVNWCSHYGKLYGVSSRN